MENPYAPATEKQIEYIKSLINGHYGTFFRAADGLKNDLDGYDNRHNLTKYTANVALANAYKSLKVPATLTQKQASAIIAALKADSTKVIEMMLEYPKSAVNWSFVGDSAEIKSALKNWY